MQPSNHKKHLIVIGGPTASGKTAFAIRLARHFRTSIISADSRQFYREMSIGTAKPTEQELAQAPHHFIGNLSIEKEYSVGDFERDALRLLEELFRERDVVILAGGSGLYVKAICEGLDEFPEVPTEVRDAVEEEYREKGLAFLQAEVKRIDPGYYEEVDRQNPHRLIRALAVFGASGKPFSHFRKAGGQPRPFTPIYLQLYWPRRELYHRIDQRVEQMMGGGLLEEARALYPRRALTALQTVGYQELFDYFDGAVSLETAIGLIQRNSRRYAKRQLTWHRRDGHWKLLRPGDWELALKYIDAVKNEELSLEQHKVDGELDIRVLKKGKKAAHLNYSERKREALLLGPFLGSDAGEWEGTLLLHQAILLADERRLFAFSPIGSELFQKVCVVEHPGPERLPGWMAPAWQGFQAQFPEAQVLQLMTG